MTKRSLGLSELENEMRDMLSSNGGLAETKWVSRYVELMRESTSIECQDYLLKVFLNTPQNDRSTFTRFAQLGGIEVLGNWINQHRTATQNEAMTILHSSLACLNKLTISTDLLDKTQIGKTVNKLVKHSDPSIQAKSSTIVSKWKKMVTEQDSNKRPKPVKETRIVLPKK